MMVQMNGNRNFRGLTLMWSVSTLGKHLRTVGIILTSLRPPQRTSKARILTLGTLVLRLTFVPACNCNFSAANQEKKDQTYALII